VADDRNQNVKKQLLKKREDAVKKKIPLAPGEMVDDALARGFASTGRWLKKNFGAIQWAIVAAIVAGAGYAAWDHRSIKRSEAASGELIKGTVAEKGRIAASTSKPEETPSDDPTPTFKTVDEKRDTALASYRKVTSTYPGSGAAILARLGEAGVLLDRRNWEGALVAYRDVKGSPLAAVDPAVKGAALEGIGLALEGKGDADEALKAFKDLEATNITGQKELGQYHQARLLLAKKDADKAKELLKSARDGIKKAAGSSSPAMGESHPFNFLERQVDDLLRRIDPSAVPPPAPPGGAGQSMSAEERQRLNEMIQRQIGGQKPTGSP
jgi:hypothetical protein